MEYLKLRRSQIILVSFVVFALFIREFPLLDIAISGLFFDGRSFPRDPWWQKLLQHGLGFFIPLSVIGIGLVYAFNRVLRMNVCGVDGRRVLYVVLVLAIGCGFIVNFGLKDHFHRARPRDIAEFGGTRQFSPAFQVSDQCRTNCSFSSGDAAGGFFALSVALALSRRRAAYVAAIALGVVMSTARIAVGAHFFSDTVTSFFVMLIVSDVLFFYLISRRPDPAPATAPEIGLQPAPVAAEANK